MADRGLTPAVRKYLSLLDDFAARLPAKLRTKLNNQVRLAAEIDDLDLSGPSVSEAVFQAVLAGKDPATDDAVRAAITRAQLSSYVRADGLAGVARGHLFDTIAENIDELVGVLKPAVEKAGAELSAAFEVIYTQHGIKTLDSPEIMIGGLDVAQANVNARRALADLQRIDQGVGVLLVQTVGKVNTPAGRHLMMVDVGSTPASALYRRHVVLSPWEALAEKYTISLATPTEHRDRAEYANAIENRATASRADAARRAGRSEINYIGA